MTVGPDNLNLDFLANFRNLPGFHSNIDKETMSFSFKNCTHQQDFTLCLKSRQFILMLRYQNKNGSRSYTGEIRIQERMALKMRGINSIALRM